MTAAARPIPVPDEQSAPYWQATADHLLTIAKCSVCGAFAHPPDVVCPHCRTTSPGFVFTPVSGRGTVRSWTVLHQSFLPGFEEDIPFVLVDVELAEQAELRLIARLVDGPDASLSIGAPVTVAWEDLTADISVPAFRLDRSS